MTKKFIDKIFIGIFVLILFLPFLLAHREDGRISDMENRRLASVPHFVNNEGEINLSFPDDFDAWINDNARFRTVLMKINATVQYRFFGKIVKDSLREGKEGHLYYTDSRVQDYQHMNLLSQEELKNYTDAMQRLNCYLEKRGISFYYMQCFEKHSIYPEYYVDGANQFGNISRANQIVEALKQQSDVIVIPIYQELMERKNEGLLYFRASDPAHWNEYGAHIGYEMMFDTIQKKFPKVHPLQESDYVITWVEEDVSIYGFEYPYKERGPRYKVRNPHAVELNLDEFDAEKVIRYREYGHYYINEDASNDLKILLIGDSYIRQFLKGHIAEGFAETLSIDWVNLTNLDKVLEIYHPNIIVFENAEISLNHTISLINEISYTEEQR